MLCFYAIPIVRPGSSCREQLLTLLECSKELGIWTILDESFVEFCPQQSIIDMLSDFPRLLVLRSFTKFYAIPGLRLGYLVGSPEVLSLISRRQPPWSVNALAQVAAVAVLKDSAYRRKSLAFVREERTRVQASLSAIPQLHVFSSAVNFNLIELESLMLAFTVVERLREAGILVRDCSNVPGLNDRTIRVAIKTRHENDRLLRALTAIVNG